MVHSAAQLSDWGQMGLASFLTVNTNLARFEHLPCIGFVYSSWIVTWLMASAVSFYYWLDYSNSTVSSFYKQSIRITFTEMLSDGHYQHLFVYYLLFLSVHLFPPVYLFISLPIYHLLSLSRPLTPTCGHIISALTQPKRWSPGWKSWQTLPLFTLNQSEGWYSTQVGMVYSLHITEPQILMFRYSIGNFISFEEFSEWP